MTGSWKPRLALKTGSVERNPVEIVSWFDNKAETEMNGATVNVSGAEFCSTAEWI